MADTGEAGAREAFVERFGGVYEHSPWVAEQSFDAALSATMDERRFSHPNASFWLRRILHL